MDASFLCFILVAPVFSMCIVLCTCFVALRNVVRVVYEFSCTVHECTHGTINVLHHSLYT